VQQEIISGARGKFEINNPSKCKGKEKRRVHKRPMVRRRPVVGVV
jgi:hypothetical protein